jgi:hypothetical protein
MKLDKNMLLSSLSKPVYKKDYKAQKTVYGEMCLDEEWEKLEKSYLPKGKTDLLAYLIWGEENKSVELML